VDAQEPFLGLPSIALAKTGVISPNTNMPSRATGAIAILMVLPFSGFESADTGS
jgi:hypothetical protein